MTLALPSILLLGQAKMEWELHLTLVKLKAVKSLVSSLYSELDDNEEGHDDLLKRGKRTRNMTVEQVFTKIEVR